MLSGDNPHRCFGHSQPKPVGLEGAKTPSSYLKTSPLDQHHRYHRDGYVVGRIHLGLARAANSDLGHAAF